jgi:hypothetical protein
VYALIASLGSFVTGCGSETGGRVSGKVTFNGQPVPAGKVYIRPDTSKGNSGPTGYADIKDGAYDTSAPGGKGAVAGAVIIAVEGLDPNPPANAGPDVTTTVLFPNYELPAEIDAGGTVKDIDVPPEAANVPQQSESSVIVP